MKFLESHLKGLPPTVQQMLLKQLEAALNEINQKFKPFSALNELQSTVLCAKIFAVLDLAAKFRRDLESSDS